MGAIAVLILFAIMLTRNLTGQEGVSPFSGGAAWGWAASLAVFCAMYYSLQDHPRCAVIPEASPSLAVDEIGRLLMTRYAVPFEVISLLLTAALVGAVVLALDEPKNKPGLPK